MATLGKKYVGNVVKIKVNGTPTDFIVVHQGLPMSTYDNSCDGTWVLMKDIYELRAWDSEDNDYENSDIMSYLNSTFYNLFDADTKEVIKTVKIPYHEGQGDAGRVREDEYGLSCNVFLLSGYEIGWKASMVADTGSLPSDGYCLSYFDEYRDTDAVKKRLAAFENRRNCWWLRSPDTDNSYWVWAVMADGGYNTYSHYDTHYGIRPALILDPSVEVDSNGNLIVNVPPTISGSSSSGSDLGEKSAPFSFTYSVSDADNNTVTVKEYLDNVLQRSYTALVGTTYTFQATSNSGQFQKILNGLHTIRVTATDSAGNISYCAVDFTKVNSAPTISSSRSSGSNMGNVSAPFSFTYSVGDADNDTVTVREYLDNVLQRSYTATLGATNTFQATYNSGQFQRILNGSHTIKVTATDSVGNSSTAYTVSFNKQVKTATITLSSPLPADDVIKAAVVTVTGNIPQDATLTVLVTNNALDASPVWEDMSRDVQQGVNHLFTNKTATRGFAFNFKVTVTRGASGTQGFISNIGGAFE